MEWYEVLIGLGLLWFIGAQWDRGIQHRRKARQEGREVRSLWWHARAAASAPKKETKPPKKPTAEQENQAAVRQAMSSPEWKAKARKARHKAEEMSRGHDAKPAETPRPASKAAPSAPRSKRLCFVYEDAQGNTSTRDLSSWRDDGVYIEGFCEQAGDIRTFRRARIVSFLEGEHLLKPAAPAPAPRRRGSQAKPLEILFTGFPASTRQMLEDDAESYGMTVRKSVTKNLDFVCAGPNAGPTKVAKASAQGCEILSEDQFYDLVEDGVLP